MLTRLAELNCSIMHQSVILYLWCSSSLSPHSAVLKFGAKRDLQACKAPCELIVLYILLICNASWYRASRAPRPSERFKERREGIPFVLSVFCLLLSALAWCSLPARRAAGPVWPSLSIAAPPVACRLSLSPVPVAAMCSCAPQPCLTAILADSIKLFVLCWHRCFPPRLLQEDPFQENLVKHLTEPIFF